MLVIQHVMTVDILALRRITTHTLVLQHVVMDVAQPVLHLIIISKPRPQLVPLLELRRVVMDVVLLSL